MIVFRVRGEPASQGSKRAFVPRGQNRAVVVDDNPKSLKSWRAAVHAAASAAYDGQPLDGPLGLRLTFYFVRPKSHSRRESSCPWRWQRPDWEKLARAVGDACKGVVWADDAQVAEAHVSKRYAEGEHLPGVEVEVWPLARRQD